MNLEITKINWIKTIFINLPDSNSTTTLILAKAWSVYETKEINGISHFLEHMFFKGGKKYKTPKEVSAAIDEIWWEFNAFTWEEYAWYYVKSAPDYTLKALDVLSDMLLNARFPEEEIEREKWVVIQEIKMYEDLPQKLVIDKFKEFYYWNNSWWRPILWPEENILKFNRDLLLEYKNSLYTKDNILIVIAWKIKDKKNIENFIEKNFSKLPNKKSRNRPPFPNYKPSKNEDFLKRNTQQTHLIIGIPGFNMFDEKRFAATVLATLLWGNMSSILFQELREKRWLCYYISMSHSANIDDGLFIIRAWLQKNKFEEWKKVINEILDEITNWKIEEEDFERAKGYLIWKLQMWLETSDQYADFFWEQILLKWNFLSLDEMIKKIQQVTISDIRQVAKNLKKENRYSYWIE